MTDSAPKEPSREAFTPEFKLHTTRVFEQFFAEMGVPGWIFFPAFLLSIALWAVHTIADGIAIPFLMNYVIEQIKTSYPCIDYWQSTSYLMVGTAKALFKLTMVFTRIFVGLLAFLALGTRFGEYLRGNRHETIIRVPTDLLDLMQEDGVKRDYGIMLERVYREAIHPKP